MSGSIPHTSRDGRAPAAGTGTSLDNAWMESVASTLTFAPPPTQGRTFVATRTVRSSDVTPGGRLRLDAVARYLQAVAEDDLAGTGWREPLDWWTRRCAVTVRDFPAHAEQVRLETFCSGTGPRWAERTTTLAGPGGELMQARAVWVAVDRSTGQPAPLGEPFLRRYGAAAAGRTVSARLSHPGPPGSAAGRPWPLRASDFDTAGHVNNAVHWAAVEDVLATQDWLPTRAEVEYHGPMLPTHEPSLVTADDTGGQRYLWLLHGSQRLASACLIR
jgi:acyl-ACP thioesterase